MKIKKIISLCIKNKCFLLYNQKISKEADLQWISNGNAMYPFDGFPRLDEESLCIMFDIDEKQREKISFHEQKMPDYICVEDTIQNENILEQSELSIVLKGEIYIACIGRRGLLLIQKEYLAPLADMGDYLELYEREFTGGKTYEVVKTGLLLRAVIAPDNIMDKQFVAGLRELMLACNRATEQEYEKKEDMGDESSQLSL